MPFQSDPSLSRRTILAAAAALAIPPSLTNAKAQASMSAPAPSRLTVASGGQSVACLKIGTGSPVVIVHGLGGHKEDFIPVMQGLARAHTVYAFDMIGFGESGRTSPTVTIGMQADAIRALVAAESLGALRLAGNSLGGWVAATYAARHPDQVERLALIDAAGLKVTFAGPPPVNFAPDTVEDMAKLLKTVIASPFAHSPDFAAQALAGFRAGGEAATLGKLFAGFQSGATGDRVLDDVLPEVKARSLVIWGAEDGLFPAALADMVVAGLPGSRKVLIPGASHFPQIDKPEELTKVLAEFFA